MHTFYGICLKVGAFQNCTDANEVLTATHDKVDKLIFFRVFLKQQKLNYLKHESTQNFYPLKSTKEKILSVIY